MLGPVSSHTAAETRKVVCSLESRPTVAGHSGDHPRTSRRYEHRPRVRIRSSFRAIWRASADEPTVKYGRPWLCERVSSSSH